jgi:hypothetical protein
VNWLTRSGHPQGFSFAVSADLATWWLRSA